MRSSRPHLLATALLVAVAGAPFQSHADDDRPRLSVRAFGLSVHLFDVSADAPYFPLKLDRAGIAVVNPGLAFSLDLPTGLSFVPYARLGFAGYADCAFQPAGYLALMPVFREVTSRHFSFGGGFGLGLAVRRNWRRYVSPELLSETFRDWGAVEGMWGLYGELDFLFHDAERKQELVISVVPGIPHILVISVGMRFRL